MPTLTFKTLYVLVFIAHGRRELIPLNVTANPTAAWIWRQLMEATPWGQKPQYLLRNRDAVYSGNFRQRARRIGIDAIVTPIHAPKANAVAEQVIGTLRRECLDHFIVLDEQHLRSALTEFVQYYNEERPHRTLGTADAATEPTPSDRPDPLAAGAEWAAPRLRTSRLTTATVLPSHRTAPSWLAAVLHLRVGWIAVAAYPNWSTA